MEVDSLVPGRTRLGAARGDQRGQTLVEFTLVVPIVVFLLMALLEVALAFNAFVGVNRVSQIGGQTAAIMTNNEGADCLILNQIEDRLEAPNRPQNIISVVIERTALAGNRSFQEQFYTRAGSTDCELPDGTEISVPYTLINNGLPPYPETERCPVLNGCPTLGEDRTTVDNIGVKVRYRHDWVTPLSVATEFLPGGNQGWAFTQRNIFRMEPTL
jgi:hypothetical protein